MKARAAIAIATVLAAACGAPEDPRGTPPVDPLADVEPRELFERAVRFAQSGDHVRAEQYLVTAIDRGFPEQRAMPLLVRVCLESSRLRTALGYAEPYLARNGDDWALRYVVATIHLGLRDAPRARQELERVIATAPEQAEPHYLLARVLRDELGDAAAAEPHFRRYLELAPEGRHAPDANAALAAPRAAAILGEGPAEAPGRTEE